MNSDITFVVVGTFFMITNSFFFINNYKKRLTEPTSPKRAIQLITFLMPTAMMVIIENELLKDIYYIIFTLIFIMPIFVIELLSLKNDLIKSLFKSVITLLVSIMFIAMLIYKVFIDK